MGAELEHTNSGDQLVDERLDQAQEAMQRAERIRLSLASAASDILAAYEARDWEVLGCDDWQDYCRRYIGERLNLSRGDRDILIGTLAGAGLLTREVAAAAGTSQLTAARVSQNDSRSPSPRSESRDAARMRTARKLEPEPPEPPGATGTPPPATPPDGEPALQEAQPEPQEQAPAPARTPPPSHDAAVVATGLRNAAEQLRSAAAYATFVAGEGDRESWRPALAEVLEAVGFAFGLPMEEALREDLTGRFLTGHQPVEAPAS